MTEKIRPRVRVAGILIEDDRILLIEHTKNDKKYWLVPGGGVDWGESAAEALIREFKEEIQNIKLYPNIKEKLIKLLNKETIEPYLGLLWDK